MKGERTGSGQVESSSWPGYGSVPRWVHGHSDASTVPRKAGESWLKRPFDLLLAMVGLAIASPLCLLFAVAIKAEDRGPIFFAQERWGRDKGRIRIHKFRSMVPNAVERFGNLQAQENDPRVTRVGRLLRATSLDEIPQLWSIARGDMSWVGPRALAVDELVGQGDDGDVPNEAIPGFEERSKLRPGLTGIAQIFAPRDVQRELKYRYDAIYAGRQSLWMDVRLILLSLWITVRARWEARESKV